MWKLSCSSPWPLEKGLRPFLTRSVQGRCSNPTIIPGQGGRDAMVRRGPLKNKVQWKHQMWVWGCDFWFSLTVGSVATRTSSCEVFQVLSTRPKYFTLNHSGHQDNNTSWGRNLGYTRTAGLCNLPICSFPAVGINQRSDFAAEQSGTQKCPWNATGI